jgi:hypothetical protein
MARSDTGKWVARAGSTGGGRTYRGRRPAKWYGSLALLFVLGVAIVWYSRYERQHPSPAGQPAIGTHWVAALSFDICGTIQPNVPTNPNTSTGIHTEGDGLIHIDPTSPSDAGANATLGRFVEQYPGMKLNSISVKYPGTKSTTVGRTFTNGERCPAGTPDANQRGVVQVHAWPTFTAKTPVIAGDPNTLRLLNGQLITVAFLPNGKPVPKPPSSVITTLLQTISTINSGSGTSSTSGSTTTTAPTTTTTASP